MPRAATKKKAAAPAAKSKVITHTDDGTPIVNATLAQIRKGTGKSSGKLVRIPQVTERSKFYAEAAAVIGERESLALPYHGGRMWKCEVRVSDACGASGDNRKGGGGNKRSKDDADGDDKPKKKKTNYFAQTPLFRWYRGSLILATLPYILDDIVEVESKMPGKKRWANGMSDDEGLDSSDEEWENDEKYVVEPITKMNTETSALTTSAYEDTSHPSVTVTRSWISPDLQRFTSRKSAVAHAEELVKRDLLIDRTLYGYGHNGVRLRPVKPTRKQALEAGMARFLRDGLWIVGQEEMWIEQRREVLVKKQEIRQMLKSSGEGESEDGGDDGAVPAPAAVEVAAAAEEPATSAEGGPGAKEVENVEQPDIAATVGLQVEEGKLDGKSDGTAMDDEKKMEAASKETVETMPESNAETYPPGAEKKEHEERLSSAANANPSMEPHSSTGDSSSGDSKPVACEDADGAKVVSPPESDASTEGATKSDAKSNDKDDFSAGDEEAAAAAPPEKAIAKRSPGTKPPPAFVPSTHYRLNKKQIAKCFTACIDHYEQVMHTVKARSLYHELADGFDVLRERGRGRYDMELPCFDTDEYSFLTDPRKAAWMPVVHKILGDDALLVHKGCFISLPGAETQVYHQDGVHLNKKVHKPCYAINVFIPLVDYDMSNGPTEFCLGTHYLGYENFVKENVYTPCVTAGTPVIFDYRLGHRGLRNFSESVRPVLYLTYSSVASGKEFRDSVNFSSKRYRKLGDFAEKPLSREERAKKRRMEK